MKRLILAAIALPLAAAASVPPPPPPATDTPPQTQPLLLTWTPGAVSCDGAEIESATMRRPWNRLVRGWPRNMEPAAYEFAIDAAGRTLSIAPSDNGRPPFADDVAPALAASRFPANAPRSHCRVLYTPQSYGLDEAPVADLVSYSINPDWSAPASRGLGSHPCCW